MINRPDPDLNPKPYEPSVALNKLALVGPTVIAVLKVPMVADELKITGAIALVLLLDWVSWLLTRKK